MKPTTRFAMVVAVSALTFGCGAKQVVERSVPKLAPEPICRELERMPVCHNNERSVRVVDRTNRGTSTLNDGDKICDGTIKVQLQCNPHGCVWVKYFEQGESSPVKSAIVPKCE